MRIDTWWQYRRAVLSIVSVALSLIATSRSARAQGEQTLSVTRIADSVYAAIYSEMKRDPVQSNSLIVITSDGVVVVDAQYTPFAARQVIAAIKKLTRLPVKYVITTHWHDDHIFGNQAYVEAYPGVQFVAHDSTAAYMRTQAKAHQVSLANSYGAAVPRIKDRLATGKDGTGKQIPDSVLADLRRRQPLITAYAAEFKSVRLVYPTVTFDRALTLQLGQRTIEVRNFGRANTVGDVVILLPKERIAAVGDLVVYPVPYIYGGYPTTWVGVMDSVRALGATTLMPGHGTVMTDFTYFDTVIDLLEALTSQVKDCIAKGMSLEETKKAVNLDALRARILAGVPDRDGTFQASIINAGIEATYNDLKARPNGD
jgi:cyclase